MYSVLECMSPRGSMGTLGVSLLMGPWNYFSALCRLFSSSNGDCLDGPGLFAVGCDEDRVRLWGHGSLLEKRVKVDLLQLQRELLPKLKTFKASQGVVHKCEGKVAIPWFGAKSAVMQTVAAKPSLYQLICNQPSLTVMNFGDQKNEIVDANGRH